MVSHEYHDFLIGSSQASAALIGLLFVAVSLAPDRVFGSNASAMQRAQAFNAFTALANAFFTSLAGLIPKSTWVSLPWFRASFPSARPRPCSSCGASGSKKRRSAGAFSSFWSAQPSMEPSFSGVRYLDKVTDEGPCRYCSSAYWRCSSSGLSRAWELMGAGSILA